MLLVILCLGWIIYILSSYYNVMILVENDSPNNEYIDIFIRCDNKTLVNDTFYYSIITPNFKQIFVHIPAGEHLIRVQSNIAGIEKSETLDFTGQRAYLFVNYEYWQIKVPNDKIGDTAKTTKIMDNKQFKIGLTTKMPHIQ